MHYTETRRENEVTFTQPMIIAQDLLRSSSLPEHMTIEFNIVWVMPVRYSRTRVKH